MSENYVRGPWEAVQNDSNEWEIWFTYGDKDQFSSFNVIGIEAESDARLIAAAPEMLDALSEALADWDDDHFDEEYPYRIEWADKARAAIAKAKGETP